MIVMTGLPAMIHRQVRCTIWRHVAAASGDWIRSKDHCFCLDVSVLQWSMIDFDYLILVFEEEQGQSWSCRLSSQWQVKVRDRRKQTYFSSAVWAAMRVRSDLSARGQPDRLEDRLERKRERERECVSENQTKNRMSEYEWRKKLEPEPDCRARTGVAAHHR